jgi:benzoyl-CoA-dihydrodiol lyase
VIRTHLAELETPFWGRPQALATAQDTVGKDLVAADAAPAELITFAPDDIDWPDEVRVALEERNSFSPDALTGMEANYRFLWPETMETKIFSRLIPPRRLVQSPEPGRDGGRGVAGAARWRQR